jgi:glutamate N-acetyltransferase/amino-acid N-acetyltransferase
VVGLAKGAAMIAPNMATMLAVVMTDAAVAPEAAQALLAEVVGRTFNRITVDGHASTNDTVLLLAGGAAGPVAPAALHDAVASVCAALARSIPADGEGATRLVEVVVRGAATEADAERHARRIAESPLVKTAIAGGDPNWGRIVSAAGASGAPFDPARASLRLQGTTVWSAGTPVPFAEAPLSARMRDEEIVAIDLDLGVGEAEARFWTCDLTEAYVRLNADYRT